MDNHGFPVVASGDISPRRFITMSGDYTVAQATANQRPIGVSEEASRTDTDAKHAVAGESVAMRRPGFRAKLEIGATVVAGERLKADASGRGVPVATTGTTIQEYGAIALKGGSNLDVIDVFVELGSVRPAIA